MNTPIDFNTAKLLKEKGFDEPTIQWYHRDSKKLNTNDLMFSMNKLTDNYSAPTIAEVVMWLYERYEIWITVLPELFNGEKIRYYPSVFEQGIGEDLEQYFDSPKEAYEAAIEYVLKNLIK